MTLRVKASTASASASPPPGGVNRTRTWLRTTSLRIVTPSVPRRPSAMRRAIAQQPAIMSASPDRPSDFNAAYIANPRARRDDSGTQLYGSRSPPAVST
jgi:hypothetical protein